MTSDPYGPAAAAAVTGATTLAWYAMPDLVRSRTLRALLKTTALSGATGYFVKAASEQGFDLGEVLEGQVWGTREVLGGALGGLIATVATVAVEKAIFAFGERRRARGRRLAHTLPALGLTALVVATEVVANRPQQGGN